MSWRGHFAIWAKFVAPIAIGLSCLALPLNQTLNSSSFLDLLGRKGHIQSILTTIGICSMFSFVFGTNVGRRMFGVSSIAVEVIRSGLVEVGTGVKGQKVETVVSVRNVLPNDIQIIGQRASCGCVFAGPFPIRIKASSSSSPETVLLRVDLAGKEEGEFLHSLTLFLDSEIQRELVLKVRGTVVGSGFLK